MRLKKIIPALALAAALTLTYGALPAAAAADGVYLTATNTYYLNPDTGETADGGTRDTAIGEGMCRSVVHKDALVEIENGKIYLTARLLLMSNIRDIRLSVQQSPGGSYQSVAPRIMMEDAGTDSADYRFELPTLTSYISWEMYVIPMGRDVKFFMNVSEGLRDGAGDFIVSVKPQPATATAAAGTGSATAEPALAGSGAAGPDESAGAAAGETPAEGGNAGASAGASEDEGPAAGAGADAGAGAGVSEDEGPAEDADAGAGEGAGAGVSESEGPAEGAETGAGEGAAGGLVVAAGFAVVLLGGG
ncbi:MAG: NEAT domain-containing protein, partial [Gracilibacteraceae bacterium]|nr:NEAT domain-containing protein [Gracilibacteraceae bacterium]